MLRNGEGPLDPVPVTALIHQLAKPLRSSVSDTRKFEAVDARRSRMPNDADQSLRQGSNSEPFPDLQRRSADVLKNQRERSDEILTYGDFRFEARRPDSIFGIFSAFEAPLRLRARTRTLCLQAEGKRSQSCVAETRTHSPHKIVLFGITPPNPESKLPTNFLTMRYGSMAKLRRTRSMEPRPSDRRSLTQMSREPKVR